MEDFIKRRIEFVLQEAKCKGIRDQSITFTMRVLSNFASVGSDGQSETIKKLNKCMSKQAWNKLKDSTNFNNWLDNLINEHQMPLKQTWNWIVENSNVLDVKTIWDHFKLYPMVTVLKDENTELNLTGNRSHGTPVERYKDAKIEIVKLTHSPKDAWKNKSFNLTIQI